MEKIPEEKDILSNIKLSDFSGKLENRVEEWIHSQEKLPEVLAKQLRDVDNSTNIRELLKKIRKELKTIYGDKKDTAKSFADSRFTPIEEMIERGMVSCGASTHIFGTTLRSFGVPVRYVHSDALGERGVDNRHSWLDIYDPSTGKWVETDPTRPKFDIHPNAKRIKEYHDWSELKPDYEKEDF